MSETAFSTTRQESADAAIGRRVRELLWDRKITNKEFALSIGVDATGLGRRLRGERGWSSDETLTAARRLDVSVAYLFGETSDSTPTGGAGWAPRGSNPRPTD